MHKQLFYPNKEAYMATHDRSNLSYIIHFFGFSLLAGALSGLFFSVIGIAQISFDVFGMCFGFWKSTFYFILLGAIASLLFAFATLILVNVGEWFEKRKAHHKPL